MTDVEIMARKYQSILIQVQGMTLSWSIAEHLVGGRKRLERLMAEDKVRYDKPLTAANSKWQFNAADILTNIKPNLNKLNNHK